MMDSLQKHITGATTSKTKPERMAAAAQFGAEVGKANLVKVFNDLKLCDKLMAFMTAEGKKGAPAREGSLYLVNELAKNAPLSAALLVPVFSQCMELQGDKVKPVGVAAVEACDSVFKNFDDNVTGVVLPELLKTLHSPQGNAYRFAKICDLCVTAPQQISTCLATAIASVVPFMHDLKKEVAQGSEDCLKALCDTCPNPDMEPFLPSLNLCMKNQDEIPEVVFKMASSTFVAEVEAATLAIMAPVLLKGLATASATAVKRQCARIIENMSKLVEEPRFLNNFVAVLLPLLDAAKEQVSDPECREVCAKAAETLTRKAKGSKPLAFDIIKAKETVNSEVKEVCPDLVSKPELAIVFDLVANQFSMLNEIDEYKADMWTKGAVPFLVKMTGMTEAQATTVTTKALAVAQASRKVVVEQEQDDDAEVLCDLPFGLAYGNKVLLRKTKLKLLRGHRYGLLGQNDSGKTSLLRAISEYQIEGFPSADEMRCVFVETDIKTELADLTVIEYMFNDPLLQGCGITKEKMEATLNSVGFVEGAAANTTQKVGTLSGGWRMKLALSRAMLLKADILLLDEPTNHLDAYNVKWVETYLLSLTNVTCVMVSHDSGLLTRVCTDVIEITDMKLKYFRGNLSTFVEQNPEAKCYFELAEEGKIDFSFPNPGPLPGVTSKGKAILRMTNIGFTYPGAPKPQLNNVTVQVSMASRVACVGENGAGKSTMIKLLTGELEPDEGSGEVWKHPNCRVGYIAQHAFHHIENHLDETANDYIRWRYANGGDREAIAKDTFVNTEEEIKLMESAFEFKFPADEEGNIIKRKMVVERFTERRRDMKTKREQEYEVQFKGMEALQWVERETLVKQGFEKTLKQLDERIALRATQFARPLTKENVQKHLADVGLAAEFSTHMRIGALSGGQKVKVVLASALWSKPHILILDEPTNYLDRESLGALARAIRKFEGGVVMITHNSQFCDNLCPVVWHLQNNTLDVKGDAEWMAEAAKAAIKVEVIKDEDMVDRFGNTIELKKTTKLTKKQLKLKAQRRKKRFKETGDDYDSDEE